MWTDRIFHDEDHITCTNGQDYDDPSGAWDCPLMVAAHAVDVANGGTDCPIMCEHIAYEIKDELPEGEAIQYCHRKGECAQKLQKGA